MNAIWPGGRLIFATGLLLSLLLAATLFSPAVAQTPQNQSCTPPLKQSAGGEAITAGKILVYLPGGYHYVMNVPEVGTSGGTLRICIIEYLAQISFNTDTGAETGRVVGVPVAAELLDLIASSARLLSPPTPTHAPVTTNPGSSQPSRSAVCSSTICPPNTGNAGLR
ncbi:MAG: hypothetical protein AB7T32_11200 [Dehalococcoidia bacterium]